MFGGTSALLTRALRLEARLMRSHVFRIVFAGLIFACLMWAHVTAVSFGAPGRHFFRSIAFLNLALITLAGVSLFATAVSEEKEDGTLGLLKMAGLSPLAILLGKSTTRLFSAALLLFAQLPFTLLAVTLGGVTAHQILAAYAALLAYMVFVANLALFFSTSCRRSGDAGGMAALVLLVLLGGPPLLRTALNPWVAGGTTAPFVRSAVETLDRLDELSVVHRLQTMLTTGFSEPVVSRQVVVCLVGGVGCFLLSWLTFDWFTRNTEPLPPKRVSPLPRIGLLRHLGIPRTWTNALMWKDFHFIAGGQALLFAKFFVYGLAAAVVVAYLIDRSQGQFDPDQCGEGVLTLAAAGLGLELSLYAARIFHDELKWKTHAVLMMLPISTLRIAYSKLAGCVLGLLPGILYLGAGILLAPDSFIDILVSREAWAAVVVFILFLHLTALFSLYVKWGALPLAIGVLVVFNFCCLSWMSVIPILIVQSLTGTEEATIMPIVYLGAVFVAPLQWAIKRRLESVAGN